jgi:putative flippase GtrA
MQFKRFILFCFWGVVTTAVNVGIYYLCRLIKIPVTVSTIIAWILCVAVAFFTNKRYVFESETKTIKSILKECFLFYGSRLFSGAIDVLFMYLTVNVFHFNEIFSKIGDEIIVSALNYILSIIIVFRKKEDEKIEESK